jgi:hypothetical protein
MTAIPAYKKIGRKKSKLLQRSNHPTGAILGKYVPPTSRAKSAHLIFPKGGGGGEGAGG